MIDHLLRKSCFEMPISREEFEKHHNPIERVTEFLKKNKVVGFTIEEISESVGIERKIIEPLLSLIPLVNILFASKGKKIQIESVTIKNTAYYRYNEKIS